MKNIRKFKPCYICHGRIHENGSKETTKLIPTTQRIIIEWYGICDVCLDCYPEITETFKRISDLPDGVGECNHSVMFNLIESIRNHFWGCRYIVPYKPKR
jgi:hypothetical protein